MTADLVPAANSPPPALPAADIERAYAFARQEKAPATRAAYKSDFTAFQAWCAGRGVVSLPATPETVAGFLAAEAEAGRKPSTIGRRCAAIRHAHRLAGHEPPTNAEIVRTTLRGIRRAVGAAPAKKAPAVAEIARDMARATPDGLKGLRDRALLLLGFAGAFRRSELIALDVSDLTETEDGLRIVIRKSKTDQEAMGETIAIVRGEVACPVQALRAWLTAAAITEGPVFRSIRKGGHVTRYRLTSKSVCDLVKGYAAKVGLDASTYGAHSLRAGFLTSAARRGASVWKLKEVSRHKNTDTLAGYVRDADLFHNHAGSGLL
jgi:site-specific recombinase XerD